MKLLRFKIFRLSKWALFLVFIALAALGLPQISIAEGTRPVEKLPELKNPVLAGALSGIVPGIGHLYSQKPLWGAIGFGTSQMLFWSGFFTLAQLQVGFVRDFGFSISMQVRELTNRPAQIAIGASILSLWIVWRVLVVWHSIRTTESFNEAILQRRLEMSPPKVEPVVRVFPEPDDSVQIQMGVQWTLGRQR